MFFDGLYSGCIQLFRLFFEAARFENQGRNISPALGFPGICTEVYSAGGVGKHSEKKRNTC